MTPFLAIRTRLSACLYISVAFAHCRPQTVSKENFPLPDAPSASKTGSASSLKNSHKSSLEILYRKSRMFPDLATGTEPLPPAKKFELFVSNSVSPLAVGGSLLSAGISQARNSHQA